MAVDVLGPRSVELYGAPDATIGTADARSSALQVMQIDLTQEILDELLTCTRTGRPPQILFGKNPRLEVGDKTHLLAATTENHRHELYCYDTDLEEGEEQPWNFSGLINHALEIRRVEEKTHELDQAMEDLKHQMATMDEEKVASRTIINSAPPSASVPQKKPKHLRTPSLLNNLKQSSRPNSPSLSTAGSPALPPTSAPTSEDHKMVMALRKAVTYFLAVKPRTVEEVVRRTRARTSTVEESLQKIAKKVPSENGAELWQLMDSAYKTLDIWNFAYDEAHRKAAQDNAIRAFDRQRVPRDSNLWQMLLPAEERGKGKVLSRLGDLSQGPRGGTPMVKAQKLDRKTGLPKKEPPKKEKKEKKSEDVDEKAQATETSRRPAVKEKSGKELGTKTSTKGNATPDRTPLASKQSRPSKMPNGVAKPTVPVRPPSQLASKPKNPSPLTSPPTNASDFEDDGGSRPMVTESPAKKRKADNSGSALSPAPKVRKVEHSSQATNGTTPSHVRTPTQQPNGVRTSAHSNKNNATKPVNGANGVNGIKHTSSSDSPSPELQLSWRQTKDMAAKFKRYYERYEKLYHQIADNPEPPSTESRQELMRMHERLREMKREISAGSLRG